MLRGNVTCSVNTFLTLKKVKIKDGICFWEELGGSTNILFISLGHLLLDYWSLGAMGVWNIYLTVNSSLKP